jgi:hypothetical protein
LKKGLILFFVQVVLTFIAAFNMRSIAQANYLWTGITEVLIAVLGFFALTEIASKTNRTAKYIGFITGSLVGSLSGILVSKLILKQ